MSSMLYAASQPLQVGNSVIPEVDSPKPHKACGGDVWGEKAREASWRKRK